MMWSNKFCLRTFVQVDFFFQTFTPQFEYYCRMHTAQQNVMKTRLSVYVCAGDLFKIIQIVYAVTSAAITLICARCLFWINFNAIEYICGWVGGCAAHIHYNKSN